MRSFSLSLPLLPALMIVAAWCGPSQADGQAPLLQPDDRLALVGGTLVERMQSSGALEAELQVRRPDWQLRVRNLGWSGDDVHGIARKVFDQPEDGFQRLMRDINTADPTVVLVAYGFAEASDGAEAVDRFEPGLRRLVGELTKTNRRVILLAPMAMPGIRVEGYDQWISQCRQVVSRVAQDTGSALLAPDWIPSEEELTQDRLHPSDDGFKKLASMLAPALVGGADGGRDTGALRELIVAKNQLFFHRYRPQNETYLFLFRKHEQGNNAVEIPQFDPLIDAADRSIWKAASGVR